MHMRLGDRALQTNWLAPTPEYVMKGVIYFQKVLPNPVFLLFTGHPSPSATFGVTGFCLG